MKRTSGCQRRQRQLLNMDVLYLAFLIMDMKEVIWKGIWLFLPLLFRLFTSSEIRVVNTRHSDLGMDTGELITTPSLPQKKRKEKQKKVKAFKSSVTLHPCWTVLAKPGIDAYSHSSEEQLQGKQCSNWFNFMGMVAAWWWSQRSSYADFLREMISYWERILAKWTRHSLQKFSSCWMLECFCAFMDLFYSCAIRAR